jgi:NADPH-dependent ferric siderophore reductase
MPKAPKWINDTVEVLLSAKMPLLRVTETEYINAHIKKIRLLGDVKGLNFQPGYAIAIRVSDTEYRNYTVSYNDTEKGIVEMIVHLHGIAPGSGFIDKLKTGDEIRLIPPRGRKMYSDEVTQIFFFGDETSLGLACALQNTRHKDKQLFHLYLELNPENRNVPGHLGLNNYTIVPKSKTFIDADLVKALPLFQTAGWWKSSFIITGNARSVQTIRKALKQNNISGNILAQAYWTEGKAGL